jgi:hypothetical protein
MLMKTDLSFHGVRQFGATIAFFATVCLFAGCNFAPFYNKPTVGKPPSPRTMPFAANGGKCFTSRS